MMLLEYEAKQILKVANIPVPNGMLAKSGEPFTLPVVLKSQVPVGGRGKLGGIRIVSDEAEYSAAYAELMNLDIKGYVPNILLAEEVLPIDKEFYLCVIIDRELASVVLLASKNGGVDIEDGNTDDFLRIPISKESDFDAIGLQLSELYDLPSHEFTLADLAKKLVDCLKNNDATLLEINPLVLTKNNQLVAADCKLILDDSAAFRHPDRSLSTPIHNANFVTLKEDGVVATIANGAGLAMATVDAIEDNGLSVANFLDVGGGANEASVLASFEKIMQYSDVKAIVINIFAGITRCDEVAKAIISAQQKIDQLPPLFIRLAGTNADEANQLLAAANIRYSSTLEACIELAKKEVQS